MIRGITRLEDVLGYLLVVLDLNEGDAPILDALATWRGRIGLWSDAERAAAVEWATAVRGPGPIPDMPAHVAALGGEHGLSIREMTAVVMERARVVTYLKQRYVVNPGCPTARFAAQLGEAIETGVHLSVANSLERHQEDTLRGLIAHALLCDPARVSVRVKPGLLLMGTCIDIKIGGREPKPSEAQLIKVVVAEAFGVKGQVMTSARSQSSEAPS